MLYALEVLALALVIPGVTELSKRSSPFCGGRLASVPLPRYSLRSGCTGTRRGGTVRYEQDPDAAHDGSRWVGRVRPEGTNGFGCEVAVPRFRTSCGSPSGRTKWS